MAGLVWSSVDSPHCGVTGTFERGAAPKNDGLNAGWWFWAPIVRASISADDVRHLVVAVVLDDEDLLRAGCPAYGFDVRCSA